MTHPIIIGELAMGGLGHRKALLNDLMKLEKPRLVSWGEVYRMVEARQLDGRGVQWNDACILASAILADLPLWTLDVRLALIAAEAGVAWRG